MRKIWMVLLTLFVSLGSIGTVWASLTTIGTATYGGVGYNLIYEDNSINGGLVWLDYTRDPSSNGWSGQLSWAAGLNSTGVLTYNLNPGIGVNWNGNWRLPITDESKAKMDQAIYGEPELGWAGPDLSGYHNYTYGYNMVNSEMGHLYYESLGNLGYCSINGSCPQSGFGLKNTGDFDHLLDGSYFSSTEYSPYTIFAWAFGFYPGIQSQAEKYGGLYALAVRPAEVVSTPVPEPTTLLLLLTGLARIGGIRKKLIKN